MSAFGKSSLHTVLHQQPLHLEPTGQLNASRNSGLDKGCGGHRVVVTLGIGALLAELS